MKPSTDEEGAPRIAEAMRRLAERGGLVRFYNTDHGQRVVRAVLDSADNDVIVIRPIGDHEPLDTVIDAIDAAFAEIAAKSVRSTLRLVREKR